MQRLARLTALLASIAATASLAPTQAPSPGLRLFGTHLSPETWLVDERGVVVHTWPSSYTPGIGIRLEPDGTLLRTIRTGSSTIPGAGGGVQRVDLGGNVLWEYRYESARGLQHHDAEFLPNGNVLLITWDFKTTAEAIAAGRDPSLLNTPVFLPDAIVEIQPTGPTTGDIVWEWHVWDHLIQDFDVTKANFGVVGDHPELIDINFPLATSPTNEFSHVNGFDYDPVLDVIAISAPLQNEVWFVDHSTTVAEAAGSTGGRHGRGGDLVYRWGNPQSYRAGTAADRQLFFQHAPTFVLPGYPGEGNLIVFSNSPTPTTSEVVEIELPVDGAGQFVFGPNGRYGPTAPVWRYGMPGFVSRIMSNGQRLPNGNTLICSATQRRVFEVTPSGQTVWSYETALGASLPFHAHHVDRSLWTDVTELSVAQTGTVTFDVIAGSTHAGSAYLLTGTASGTTPGFSVLGPHVPLNPDAYFSALLAAPNAPPFAGNLGLLDGNGRATATLTLPRQLMNLGWLGTELNHSAILFDTVQGQFTHATNAVPLGFRR